MYIAETATQRVILPGTGRSTNHDPPFTSGQTRCPSGLGLCARSTCLQDIQILPGMWFVARYPTPCHSPPPLPPLPLYLLHYPLPIPVPSKKNRYIPEVFHVFVRSSSRRCARRSGLRPARKPRDCGRPGLAGRSGAAARVLRAESNGWA